MVIYAPMLESVTYAERYTPHLRGIYGALEANPGTVANPGGICSQCKPYSQLSLFGPPWSPERFPLAPPPRLGEAVRASLHRLIPYC